MADPSGIVMVVGCATAAVAAAAYGRFDRSLAPYDWWTHYARDAAPRARRILCAAHGCVGLVSGVVLASVTQWFPFGTGVVDAIGAGLTWATFGEAAFRAEAAALDLGRAKPGISLIRKSLTGTFERLNRLVDEAIDEAILKRCGTSEQTIDTLVELFGLDADAGSIGSLGAAAAVETLSQRLRSAVPSERDGARVEGLKAIKTIVVEQRIRL